jgi:C4-dicarboxylate-specific signal transduction histidine kinase
MGEVATGMAHELNQPLSAIVNYANGCTRRIQNGVGESAELLGALEQVKSQAQRAGEIIRRLRALVGKQPPIRADVDLNALVREVCGFLEFETEKLGIEIALELDSQPIPVHVDLVQIEQVLLNLVRNGLDALEDVAGDRRSLTIRTGSDGAGYAMVSVADTGPGVSREALLQLFDPFYTTKAGGMGMGLAISQTIVENHDGRIWAESEPHRGTVFHVVLPLARVPGTPFESAGDGEPDREDAPPETARAVQP